jgi:hypothetical protein
MMHQSSQELALKIGGVLAIFALFWYFENSNGKNELVIRIYLLFHIIKVGFLLLVHYIAYFYPNY